MRRLGGADVERNAPLNEIELEPLSGKAPTYPQLVHLAPEATRNAFVRKVYGILAVQLVTTALLAGMIVTHGRAWLKSSPSAVLSVVTISCVVSLAIAGVFACCPETMRRSPGNYVLLALLTLAEGVMVGVACLQYTQGSVLLCLGLTAVVVVGLTSYALTTKTDLTSFGPYLFCGLLVLCGTGFIMSIVSSFGLTHNPMFSTMQVLYAGAGALVFSFYVIYDTQMIVGGRHHEHEFSVDDYAMAAICLYLDIIQLFLSLLRLLGEKDDGL